MSFFKELFGKKVLHEGEDIIDGIFLQLLNHFKLFIYFLFIASSNGHIEVVKELLDSGANIEEKDNLGWTPLIWGIFLQLLNHFKLFIYFLFIASFNGHIKVVKELLERGANIEEKDNYGNTPLIWGIFLQLLNHFK
jgi:ankyrin repeat protein